MIHDPLASFQRLATQAATEQSPSIDVADRVLETLAAQRVSRAGDREMAVCGAASVLVAGLALSVLWMRSSDESLLPLVQPFVTILP